MISSALEVFEDEAVFTVYQLNQSARSALEHHLGQIWVRGELSNLATPRSGHIYFTLKDAKAQIRCAMFKGNNQQLSFMLQEGMAVLVNAFVSIYEERGDYQLIVKRLEKVGIGFLQQAFEALKEKLRGEGLFDSAHKKPLPLYPKHIGIITSQTGAALQDILNVLKRRYPIVPFKVYHTAVQGKDAAFEIIEAIKKANVSPLCVIILARGGGSLEDLWCFNDENVVRSIYASHIPIVTGIGHEVDFTLADFVADRRAPTPSAAAEIVTPDQGELFALLEEKRLRIIAAMQRYLQQLSLKIDFLDKQLIHPKQRLEQAFLKLEHLQSQFIRTIYDKLKHQQNRINLLSEKCKNQAPLKYIENLQSIFASLLQHSVFLIKQKIKSLEQQWTKTSVGLHQMSPLATLSRGYAVVTDPQTQETIHNISQLKISHMINILLSDGSFTSKVVEITK